MTLAILSGAGQLPVMIKQAHPDAHVVGFEGMPTELIIYSLKIEKPRMRILLLCHV